MQVSPGFTVSECGYLSLATCALLRRTSWCVYPDARTLRPLLPLVPASRGCERRQERTLHVAGRAEASQPPAAPATWLSHPLAREACFGPTALGLGVEREDAAQLFVVVAGNFEPCPGADKANGTNDRGHRGDGLQSDQRGVLPLHGAERRPDGRDPGLLPRIRRLG